MFRTLKCLLENCSSTPWKQALLAGAIVLSPTLVMAGDKDKDKDKDRGGSNKQGQAVPIRQGESIPPVTTMSAPRGSNKFDGDAKSKINFRTDDSSKLIKAGDLNLNPIQQSESSAKKGLNNDSNKESNKKTFKPGDLKTSNQEFESGGKKNQNTFDPKGPDKLIDADKGQSDKIGKKLVKPTDPKVLNKQAGPFKPQDGNNKKSPNLDDHKLVKGDLDKDDLTKANFLEQHKNGKFDGVVKGAVAKKLDLGKQFNLKHNGDLTLQMNLSQKIKMHGGWSKSHWSGLIGPGFGAGCSPIVYCGPGYFPSHCLYPAWTPWVEFCWGFHCDPICDPRPWFCRPWIYAPCATWVCWDYPAWYELPVVCGTWVDVEPVVIQDGLDLQLLAVRFVDPGQPELREGPRYRVWARNNSSRTILKDFNILLMASNDRLAVAGLPQAGVRVESIEPGEIKAFDIRLPFEATIMGRDAAGNAAPFSQLHAIVDSHREIPEVFEENNGAVIARGDVLPVDPVIFGADTMTPLPGNELNIAGEGFGPEPGQVLVHVGGIELQAEIEGWYDLGVRVKLPALALASPTDAELILIRGDTAASNPLTVQLTMPVASR